MLSVRLLGHPSFSVDGQALSGLDTLYFHAFLGALLLCPGREMLRRDLAQLLWPASDESDSATNLRQLIHRLRSVWPDLSLYFDIGRSRLAFRPTAPISLDTEQLEQVLALPPTLDTIGQIEALYRGPLLQTVDMRWVNGHRTRTHLGLVRYYRAAIQAAQQDDAMRSRAREAFLRLEPGTIEEWHAHFDAFARRGELVGLRETFARANGALKQLDLPPFREELLRSLEQRLLAEAPAGARKKGPSPTNGPAQQPEHTASERRLGIIGRDVELKTLRTLWQRASSGGQALALIKGGTGIGKSCLAEHFAASVRDSGAASVRVGCSEGSMAVPYAALSRLLKGIPVATLPLESRLQLCRLLPSLRPSHANWERLPPLDSGVERLAFHAVLSEVLSTVSPVLVVVDDVQWCDPETLQFLSWHFQEEPQGGAMLLLIRNTMAVAEPGGGLKRILENANGQSVHEMALEPLSNLDVRALILEIEGQEVGEERLQSLCLAAEGNPLYLMSLLRSQGGVTGASGAPLAEASYRERIRSLCARLPQVAQDVAAVAAVMGSAFEWSALEAQFSEPQSAVEGLETLLRAGYVREQASGQYAFAHQQIHRAIYEGLSTARAQHLHYAIAQYWIRQPSLSLHRRTVLMEHLRRGGRPEESATQVLEICKAYAHLGGMEQALALATEARAMLPEGSEPRLRWQLTRHQLEYSTVIGSLDTARGVLKELERLLPEQADQIEARTELLECRLNLASLGADVGAIRQACTELTLQAELAGKFALAATSYVHLSILADVLAEPELAEHSLRRAESLARQVEDQEQLLHIRMMWANRLARNLDLVGAEQDIRLVLPSLSFISDMGLASRFGAALSTVLMACSRYFEVAHLLEDLRTRLMQRGGIHYANWMPYFIGRAYFCRGDFEKSLQVLQVGPGGDGSHRDARMRCQLTMLEVWLALGKLDKALHYAEELEPEKHSLPGQVRLLFNRGRTSLVRARKEWDALVEQCGIHLADCRNLQQTLFGTGYMVWMVEALTEQGKYEQAYAQLEEFWSLGPTLTPQDLWPSWRMDLLREGIRWAMKSGNGAAGRKYSTLWSQQILKQPDFPYNTHETWAMIYRLCKQHGWREEGEVAGRQALSFYRQIEERFQDDTLREIWRRADTQVFTAQLLGAEGVKLERFTLYRP